MSTDEECLYCQINATVSPVYRHRWPEFVVTTKQTAVFACAMHLSSVVRHVGFRGEEVTVKRRRRR